MIFPQALCSQWYCEYSCCWWHYCYYYQHYFLFLDSNKVMTENFKPSNSENVLNCSHCIEFIPQRRYNIALKQQWKTTKNENKKARENVFVNRVAFTALFMLLMSVRSNLCSCLLTLRSLGWGNEDWTEQNPTEEGSLQAILTHKIGCGGKEN